MRSTFLFMKIVNQMELWVKFTKVLPNNFIKLTSVLLLNYNMLAYEMFSRISFQVRTENSKFRGFSTMCTVCLWLISWNWVKQLHASSNHFGGLCKRESSYSYSVIRNFVHISETTTFTPKESNYSCFNTCSFSCTLLKKILTNIVWDGESDESTFRYFSHSLYQHFSNKFKNGWLPNKLLKSIL